MLKKNLRIFLITELMVLVVFSIVIISRVPEKKIRNHRLQEPTPLRRVSPFILNDTVCLLITNLSKKAVNTDIVLYHTTRLDDVWITVKFVGQLGNQMFQLASAYGIAKSRKSKMCLDGFTGSDLEESVILSQNLSQCSNANFKRVMESGFAKYDATLSKERGNIVLYQYLQSYKYFDEVPFHLKPKAWAERWVEEHGVSVGIHVRRGDYVFNRGNGGRPPPPVYFEYCLHLLRQRHGPLRAVVVSDDLAWVRAQPIFADAILHRGSPAEDMALLAACQHIISSIGTFGWWAMRLKTRPGECFYYADPWDFDVVPRRRETFLSGDVYLPEWQGVGDAELTAFSPLDRISTSGRVRGTPKYEQ